LGDLRGNEKGSHNAALRDGEALPAPSALSEINPAAILKDFEMESAADSAFVNIVLVDMTEYDCTIPILLGNKMRKPAARL